VNGNVKELKDIYAQIPNNEVKCLLGVKDGQYQDIYTKYFQRASIQNHGAWSKALKEQYGEFKSDFQRSLEFKPYEGSTNVDLETPTDMPDTNSSGGGEKKKYNFFL